MKILGSKQIMNVVLFDTEEEVLKRMKILGSKQIMNVVLFDTEEEESELNARYSDVCNNLLQAIDKNLPGAEESETSSASGSSEDEMDDEETVHDKKTM
ncbi:unnamed protein product [Cylicostephanus goldi]|uniref:Uncharacterized protein n=1 Tax=Cylicostephanus goldi TaxID=71465 RepID=A0A3P7MXN1_CYLGO|nr:unnamed protein product [Cylicostephanus goldi]